MRRILSALVLMAVLFTMAAPALAGHQPQTGDMLVTSCREYVSLRERASAKSERLMKVPLGESVYFLADAQNGFYHVLYKGVRGYILDDYLVYDGVSIRYVNNCEEYISLRTAPSTKAERIVKIPKGAMVYTASGDVPENGFVYVNYGEYSGYALASYLTLTPWSADETLEVTNCEESITLRKTPSTSGKSIYKIGKGSTVQFLSEAPDGYVKVLCWWDVGYVLSCYLQPY